MSKDKPVSFSALTERRVILLVWRYAAFAGLLVFISALVFSYYALNSPSALHNAARYRHLMSAFGVIELGGIVFSAIAVVRNITVRNSYHERVFHQFVKDNNWKTKTNNGTDDIPGILLGTGESYEQGFGFVGRRGGQEFNCLIFEFTKSDSDLCRYICLRFVLPKSYPMIIIDNRLNNHRYWPRHSNLPAGIPDGVSLSLEGDFNEYFRASTTQGAHREALEVLSPEFMAGLEDGAKDKVDIEISGKNLFLIYEANNYSKQNLTSLFDTADIALSKLRKQSKTWMASSKGEERIMADSALSARHKLIFRSDLAGFIVLNVTFVLFVILMVSHVRDEPPCTQADPCYYGRAQTGP